MKIISYILVGCAALLATANASRLRLKALDTVCVVGQKQCATGEFCKANVSGDKTKGVCSKKNGTKKENEECTKGQSECLPTLSCVVAKADPSVKSAKGDKGVCKPKDTAKPTDANVNKAGNVEATATTTKTPEKTKVNVTANAGATTGVAHTTGNTEKNTALTNAGATTGATNGAAHTTGATSGVNNSPTHAAGNTEKVIGTH